MLVRALNLDFKMRKKATKKTAKKKATKKSNIFKYILGLGAAFLLFSSFKNKKKTTAGIPLISQIDAPTGTTQVYSKLGTQLFNKDKNIIMTYDYAGAGMTVTGYNNGIYSVVYGDSFINGLPAYVNATDVITN
jgi:hypothetical protein